MSAYDRHSVEIQPGSLESAHYVLADNGMLFWREDLPLQNQHPYIAVAGTSSIRLQVTYDSHTARVTAAQLLGYARQFSTQEPLPARLSVDLLDPSSRTASTSTWFIGPGLSLSYHAPFASSLDSDTDTWVLTPSLATRWARALLTLATELDHARAVASHAVLAERGGTTPTANIRDWVQRMAPDDSTGDAWIFHALRDVLDEEDNLARQRTLTAALDIANPGLPTTLTDLHLNATETLTHLDAAKTIRDLAAQYGIPLFMWTEEHWWLARHHLSVDELTEAEWHRFTGTPEIRDFPRHIEQRQQDGHGIDFELALKQAGLSCRECSARIRGHIADTYGHCEACLPADRTAALTEALERGCPSEPFDQGIGSHSGEPGAACNVCGLPLPKAGGDIGKQLH